MIQRGSGDDWPFLRLPSTCSLADGANGPSSQWVWLDWGDTRSLLWNPSSRRGLSKTYARLMLVSFHLEGKNDTKILKKTIIQTVLNFLIGEILPKNRQGSLILNTKTGDFQDLAAKKNEINITSCGYIKFKNTAFLLDFLASALAFCLRSFSSISASKRLRLRGERLSMRAVHFVRAIYIIVLLM